MSRLADLRRVGNALEEAQRILQHITHHTATVQTKACGDLVTEADHAVNAALCATLPAEGEGWLSEESSDDAARLGARRVWVVDPLDGTKEFMTGLPEWCVSVALVEDGDPVAGGICNPATGETIVGGVGLGVTLNGVAVSPRGTTSLEKAEVLASRSEFMRGLWKPFLASPFTLRPCGSVAYKLALVAAGLIDATWTLVPKHEWDVAAGVALVRAAGAEVWIPGGGRLAFNQPVPKLPALAAAAPGVASAIKSFLDRPQRAQP